MEDVSKIKKRIMKLKRVLDLENKSEKPNHKKIKNITKIIAKLENMLEKESGGVTMTDTAMLQYLKTIDIPVDNIRDSLLKIIGKQYMGNGRYQLADNVYAIITNKTVSTIIKGEAEYNKRRISPTKKQGKKKR